jgi:hypothetical protein
LWVIAGVRFFTVDGELYMAVAQSVCEDYHTIEECRVTTAQPRSAVLQYNRPLRRFTEMQAYTDGENVRLRGVPVSEAQMRRRPYALRLDVGRAVSWEFFSLSGRPLLVAVSLSHGVIAYEFKFKTINSLKGAIGVTSDSASRRVFLVHGGTATVTAVYRGPSFDKTGASRGSCSPYLCLGFGQVLQSSLAGAAKGISWRDPHGLLPVGGDRGLWGVDHLAVVSGTHRDEVMLPLTNACLPSGCVCLPFC